MRKFILVAAAAGTVVATPAVAGTNSSTLNVSAQVIDSCEVDDATLSWTGLGVLAGSNHDTSTTMGITCSKDAVYKIALGGGLHEVTGQRYMNAGGTDSIPYDLYLGLPTTGTLLTSTTAPVTAGTGDGTKQNMTIGGRIPLTAANVAAGTYTDTVAVTISF